MPVTLFEVQDLLQLAHQQHRWADLIGHARSESSPSAGIGMLLFTEAHLEYNAGLVVSIGNRNKHSPLEHDTSAQTLAKSLQAGRLALVSRARSPVNPSDTVMSGTLFTPFVGIAMQSALDLCMVWSLYGLYMCKHFWPMPVPSPEGKSNQVATAIPSQGAHPRRKRANPLGYQLGTSHFRTGHTISAPDANRAMHSCVAARRTPFPGQCIAPQPNATCHISCLWQGQNWSTDSSTRTGAAGLGNAADGYNTRYAQPTPCMGR